MQDNGFLQVYDLTLTTKAPLFIGDGGEIQKKLYLYDDRSGRVSFFDEEKLFALLVERDLIDQYEAFMMGGGGNLYGFLRHDCGLKPLEWKSAIRYSVDARDSLDRDHSLKNIKTFIRDAHGRVYIPGSSVKGALHTVILQHMILDDPVSDPSYHYEGRKSQGKFDAQLESRYLYKLNCDKKKKNNMINSIMRGIQVSDSLPVPDEDMILAMKKDAHTDGGFGTGTGNIRGIVCRESIRPGTKLRLKLTLDQSILHGAITGEKVMEYIREDSDYYRKTYLSHFVLPHDAVDAMKGNCIALGGGAGYLSKTLLYPYLGEEKGLKEVAYFMKSKFGAGRHERDEQLGISPHTMEYSLYQGSLYPMGVCEVSIT